MISSFYGSWFWKSLTDLFYLRFNFVKSKKWFAWDTQHKQHETSLWRCSLVISSFVFCSAPSHHSPSFKSQQHVLCDEPGPRHSALCSHPAHGRHVLLWRVRISLHWFKIKLRHNPELKIAVFTLWNWVMDVWVSGWTFSTRAGITWAQIKHRRRITNLRASLVCSS